MNDPTAPAARSALPTKPDSNFNLVNTTEIFKDDEIYVYNRSEKGRGQKRGDVCIAIMSASDSQNVIIPNTWIPWNVTGQATKEQLKASSHFLRALSSKILKYVPAAEARELIENDPLAQKELQRQLDKLNGSAAERVMAAEAEDNRREQALGIAPPRAGSPMAELRRMSQVRASEESGAEPFLDPQANRQRDVPAAEAIGVGVTPVILEALTNPELDDDDLLNVVKTNESVLTKLDWKYIVNNSESPDLRRMASAHLRNGDDDLDDDRPARRRR